MPSSPENTPLPLPPAREEYQRELEHADQQIRQLRARQATLVWTRTILFLGAAICLLLGYSGDDYRLVLLSAGWLFAAAFLVAIVRHEHLRLTKLRHVSDARLFQRLLARLDRTWDQVPSESLLPEYAETEFADDLDVAGNASLLAMLSLAGTRPGRRMLQSWLIETPTWEQVESRQRAVKLLRDHRSLRLSVVRTVLAGTDAAEDAYGLPRWSATPSWLEKHRMAHALSYVSPALVLAGLALLAFLAMNDSWQEGRTYVVAINTVVGLIGSGCLINILLTVFWGSWLHDIFHQVTGQHQAVYGFAAVFDALESLPDDDGLLATIRTRAVVSPQSAQRGFAKMLWYVRLANLQKDPLLYFVYLTLQLAFAWDFRILKLLEGWKREFGAEVAGWFEALGTCEALISSATLADEYREWAFPEPSHNPGILLQTRNLGHPLLADSSCIPNDLTLESSRPLLLVTGSNMAGKSTFMRAIGLNLLLARTGSPVCAASLQAPFYELATSIRVRDSLRDGVSFFMAELHRLKDVVDLAEAKSNAGDAPILFLLDEVLQGTNSRERQIAVASVLEKLLRVGAVGLLSTHDLDLASEPRIEQVSQVVHFREFFDVVDGREVMRFDYKMRPGPTPTTNALKLLSLVGLADADLGP